MINRISKALNVDVGTLLNAITGEENDPPHIALDNIRERLKITCRGTLTISPREGGGTVVTMTIPD